MKGKHLRKVLTAVFIILLISLPLLYFFTKELCVDYFVDTVLTLPEGSYLRIDYVDVGQADFIVLECDGEYMTIDGGNIGDRDIVASTLESRRIKKVDTVVITHAHEDHCGGTSAVFDCADVETVYCPVTDYNTYAFQNILSCIEREGVEITVPVVGEMFSLGSAQVQILGPFKRYEEHNNDSIVLRVTYGDTSFLFTGDAETISENDIMAMGFDISSDVLKVGHHGSNTSTSYRWLRTVDPLFAVISSSREDEPDYNHPHQEVVSRLRDKGMIVFRTDLQGTITCVSDGKKYCFTVEKDKDIDTLFDAGEGGKAR